MIFLIGGVPRVGKSVLASLILERDHIPIVSTDVIRNLLDFSPTKLGITQMDESERSNVFFPYLLQFLKILQNRYPSYVVEGDIFTPKQVAVLREEITLRCCFMGVSHISVEDIIKTDARLDWIEKLSVEERAKLSPAILQGNWVSRMLPAEQAMIPDKLIAQSQLLKSEARTYSFSYFDIYPDREKALEAAYTFLTD